MAKEKKEGVDKKAAKKKLAAVVEITEEKDENVDLKDLKAITEVFEHLNTVRFNEIVNNRSVKQSLGHWYPSKTYGARIDYPNYNSLGHNAMFTTVGMIGGCGVLQSLGLSAFLSRNGAKAFKEQIIPKLVDDSRGRAAGAIFATLGAAYYGRKDIKEILDEMSFEEVAHYPNYQHGQNGSYKQKMYILNIGKIRDKVRKEEAARKRKEKAAKAKEEAPKTVQNEEQKTTG